MKNATPPKKVEMQEVAHLTVDDFPSRLPLKVAGGNQTFVAPMKRETLIAKFQFVIERRRWWLGLKPDQADSGELLFGEKVDECLQNWKEAYLTEDFIQYKLHGDKKKPNDEYVEGVSALPKPPLRWKDLSLKKNSFGPNVQRNAYVQLWHA